MVWCSIKDNVLTLITTHNDRIGLRFKNNKIATKAAELYKFTIIKNSLDPKIMTNLTNYKL